MADVFTKEKRSFVMSRIRSSGNTNTELELISLLRRNKLSGWRRSLPIPGKPDLIFKKERTAIFIDGCFWHGCPKCYRKPKSNVTYWRMKKERNQKRDNEINRLLKKEGWRVIRIWECALKKKPDDCIRRIEDAIYTSKKDKTYEEMGSVR